MRVIAGSAKGVKLAAPPGTNTRPTSDRVKEALFSILNYRCDLEGAIILDICAGTGALGIEALSRGASRCCFIEYDRSAMLILEKNLATCGLASKAERIPMDVMKALPRLAQRSQTFDIVFFDPPYLAELYYSVIDGLCSLELLSDDALVVAECSTKNIMADRIGSLVKFDRRVYGDTTLEFFAREQP